MNILKRIKIENVKGKSQFELSFNDLNANQPNIVVAPNGYGKSTIATAFKAATHGRMKLDTKDIYQQNPNNHPKLEIEFLGDHAGVFTATDSNSNISTNISLHVISSPLYAKSTSRFFGQRATSSADLRIEDVVIYATIPQRCALTYPYQQIKRKFGERGKLFLNISSLLENYHNISRLLDIRETLNKCITQSTIQRSFTDFLNKCPTQGTAAEIKGRISYDEIELLRSNEYVSVVLDCIEELKDKPVDWLPIDGVFTAIQLCEVLSKHYANGERDIVKKVHTFLEYQAVRKTIDQRLKDFNTTGRELKTHETNGRLIVSFERADSLSNGERDILSFIVNITKFEHDFRKMVGILIIDEVFDYLDRSNMLAVQYYLSEMIKSCKKKGKILYPLIFTHLDPSVFANYYFKKMKTHYISFSGPVDLTTDIIKMLRLREDSTITDIERNEIAKYYLHFTDEQHSLSAELSQRISDTFAADNTTFRATLYQEVTDRYLCDQRYDPVVVIAGIRTKIEELVYQQLQADDKEGFITEHKVINKLNYALERGIEVPELYFLLQPLYNDGLHLGGNDNVVRQKITSCYLKTNNLHIKRMVKELFR